MIRRITIAAALTAATITGVTPAHATTTTTTDCPEISNHVWCGLQWTGRNQFHWWELGTWMMGEPA